MKKNNRNLIVSIVAVALIIVLAGGATYAWYTWVSANNTAIDITVTGITYTLDGGGSITSGKKMAPTDQCNHSTYGIKRTITAKVVNSTDMAAKAYVQLRPSVFPSVFKNANVKWVLTTSSSSCSTSGSSYVAHGDFGSTTQGTLMPLTSFDAPAHTTTDKTYYLYIWVGEGYTVQNTGNTVTNSIQDQSFTLQLTGSVTNDPSAT